jgi:hypothetical protein
MLDISMCLRGLSVDCQVTWTSVLNGVRLTERPSDVLYHAHLYLKSTSTPTMAAAALIPLSRVS